MEIPFRLPSLGADMESATLREWLKKPGETVRRGEGFAIVETEKGLIDIESFDEGTVTALLVAPGTKVTVGTVLAQLSSARAAGGAPPAGPAAAPPAPTPAAPVPVSAPAAQGAGPAPPVGPGRLRISPAARARAHELGVALEALEARGGIVHVEDIERLAAQARAPAADERSAMRIAIGKAMARAKREIPHYYLEQTVDFALAREWLARHNAALPVQERLIEAVLMTKAVALAAARVEGFNGYFRDDRFERSAAVHVGTAIAVRGGGLVAPALFDADKKDLATLMREFSELVARVRSGRMRSGEFTAATITLTSLGEEGAERLYPIINPPQVAIVGAGSISERPWLNAGAVAVRPLLALTLAADHRVTDGRAGSRFLRTIADLLSHPETL